MKGQEGRFIQQRRDPGHVPSVLRSDQQANRAGAPESHHRGHPSSFRVIDDQQRIADLHRQCDCGGFAEVGAAGQLSERCLVVNRPRANRRGARGGAPVSEELDAIVEFGGDLRGNPKLREQFLEEGEMSDLDEAADRGGIADRDHPDDKVWTSWSRSSVVYPDGILRICFEWPEGARGPVEVEIVDYH